MRVTQRIKPEEGPPEEDFMQEAVTSFRDIASSGDGAFFWVTDPNKLSEKIQDILKSTKKGGAIDLVLCLDTTGSMSRYIAAVRRTLIPVLRDIISEFSDFRIGMVLYKDYRDAYITRIVPFTRDFSAFQQILNSVTTGGGGTDLPEAVYEALYDGAYKMSWEASLRLMILIGDAPAHSSPKGSINKDNVDQVVAERGINVHTIILPSAGPTAGPALHP